MVIPGFCKSAILDDIKANDFWDSIENRLGWRRCLEKHGQLLSPQLILNQALGIDQQLTQT